jgi:hypothetical protein
MESAMDDRLIAEIQEFVQHHPPPKLADNAMLSADEFRTLGFTPQILYPTASASDVAKAEVDLGFPLPHLLKRLYLEVSNGIAGFAYDIMGLHGGCASDSGTLIDAYRGFKAAGESETSAWKEGLLPFCDWGCAIYSCVDCTHQAHPVFTYEDVGVWPERYNLAGFFAMWLQGSVPRSQERVEVVTHEIINPFTGQKTMVSGRKRKKP